MTRQIQLMRYGEGWRVSWLHPVQEADLTTICMARSWEFFNTLTKAKKFRKWLRGV